MTISAVDTDLFFRANDFMTSAATTTQYFKEMNQRDANGMTSHSSNPSSANHNALHITTTAQAAAAAAVAETNELELNFLSEFLMHEDFSHDPAVSPPPSSSSTSMGGGVSFNHLGSGGPYDSAMKHEATMAVDSRFHNVFPAGGGNHQSLSLQEFQQQQQQQQQQQNGSTTPAPSSPQSCSSTTGSVADANEPVDRKAKRRQQVAISARRHRSRKKNELLDLRKEVNYMTSQLGFLRSKHKMMRPNGAVAEWEEKAMAQRRKRRQAESQSEELRRAIFMQSQFLGNLKSVFSSSPMFTDDLNLRQLLHTYTRLGRNPRSRQRDYESICQQAKLQMATDILRRQTDSIQFMATPFLKTQLINSVDTFGATIVSVYAFETLDVARIFHASCAAIRESSNTWPEFIDMDGQRKVVDILPASNIVYGKQTTRYKSESEDDDQQLLTPQASHASEEIIVETRVISFWQVTEQESMLVWDYVDDDDLHPLRGDCDIKRDMVGALLVRRELCEDGKERVVCRSICSKLHSRLPSRGQQAVASTTTEKSVLEKFASSPSRSLTRMCGNVVFQSMQKATAGLSLS